MKKSLLGNIFLALAVASLPLMAQAEVYKNGAPGEIFQIVAGDIVRIKYSNGNNTKTGKVKVEFTGFTSGKPTFSVTQKKTNNQTATYDLSVDSADSGFILEVLKSNEGTERAIISVPHSAYLD